AMTETEYAEFRDSKIAAALAHWEECRIRDTKTVERYKAMLAKVEAWDCPEELSGMKDFMREQLTSSIEWDKPRDNPWGTDMPATRADYLASLRSQLTRAEEQWAEEVERTEGRNRYRKLLAESVGMPP